MPGLAGRRAKVVLGTLVIVGVLVALWAIYRPIFPRTVETKPPPGVPLLQDAQATVVVRMPQLTRTLRATITCEGRRRVATGFWRSSPREACDALVSTRGALIASRGCDQLNPGRLRMTVTGSFGTRRFEHRQQRGGCTDLEGWLAVNALVVPVAKPDQEIEAPY
jgi:hypothetical protein